MNVDQITERLLWLEAQGLTISAEARYLRRKLRTTPLVDEEQVTRAVARLSEIAASRHDELTVWRGRPLRRPRPSLRRPGPGPRPRPVARGLWARFLGWLRAL